MRWIWRDNMDVWSSERRSLLRETLTLLKEWTAQSVQSFIKNLCVCPGVRAERDGGREAGVGSSPHRRVPARDHRGHRARQSEHRAAQTEREGESEEQWKTWGRVTLWSLWSCLLQDFTMSPQTHTKQKLPHKSPAVNLSSFFTRSPLSHESTCTCSNSVLFLQICVWKTHWNPLGFWFCGDALGRSQVRVRDGTQGFRRIF